MNTKGLTGQDSDDRLTEEAIQIDAAQPWEQVVACQFPSSEVWGNTSTEENAFRPAGIPEFNLGPQKYVDGCYSRSECFTPDLYESVSGGERRW